MSEERAGIIVQHVTCGHCLMLLLPESGDDCPKHTLPCCGGSGTMHAAGCPQDSMFKAGQRAGLEYNRRILEAVLKPLTPDDRPTLET